jgi:glycosyltransferase involved in cell wall biosynthesis
MQGRIVSDYRLPANKVRVVPNYVETDVFCPQSNLQRAQNRVITVARLEPQKNLNALLEACVGLDIELLIIGSGKQEQALKTLAKQLGLCVNFQAAVPNYLLPKLLNTAAAFILTSLYEGHPKALLEAMSCGLPVIGTDVPGIREVLAHGKTGFLCGTSSSDIRTALQEVLGDPVLRQNLGTNARQIVVDQYSLDRVIELELDLLRELSR